jgi:hypothetical protein
VILIDQKEASLQKSKEIFSNQPNNNQIFTDSDSEDDDNPADLDPFDRDAGEEESKDKDANVKSG